MNNITDQEKSKYEEIWALPEYADQSPGENLVHHFGKISGCRSGESIIDLGCGSAKGSLVLEQEYGLRVTMFDITPAGIDPRASYIPFIQGCLWRELPGTYKYGYCCDVMEHLPEQFVMVAIQNMLKACDHVYLNIANFDDVFGEQIGQPLHLTVKPFVWWRDNLKEISQVLDARDFLASSLFYIKALDSDE